MALTSYVKTTWANGTSPALNDTNLNKIETGIYDVTEVAKTNEAVIATLPATYEPKDAAIAKTDENNLYSVAQRSLLSTVTYAASVAFDMDTSNHFAIDLTGNITLANPTNTTDDEIQEGTFKLTQDATGGRTLTMGTNWTLVGTDNTDTSADKINIYKYIVIDSTNILYEHYKAI